MTVDLPIAAACVGFVWYGGRSGKAVYGVLALAPLIRETGMILAWQLLLRSRRFSASTISATALLQSEAQIVGADLWGLPWNL
jgi:hypothetical protein